MLFGLAHSSRPRSASSEYLSGMLGLCSLGRSKSAEPHALVHLISKHQIIEFQRPYPIIGCAYGRWTRPALPTCLWITLEVALSSLHLLTEHKVW